MPWIVKLDKEDDYIGKHALEHYAEIEPETRLVGFTMPNGHVPTEGAVVLRGGVPAGQVTSSRYSPQVGQVIGLAWVPADVAADEARITISDEGATYDATVRTRPFYDPEGEVLRS
jgi:aminomethyltransferase